MAERQAWLEESADVIVDELAHFGLVASRDHVKQLICERVAAVAAAQQITERSARRYVVNEEALRKLAQNAAVMIADEQPGADLLHQDRTVPISLPMLGRVVAALAEAGHVRELNADSVGLHGALQLISTVGQVIHEQAEGSSAPILLPRAVLARAARLLDATAAMIRSGAATVPEDLPSATVAALGQALTKDAALLRSLLDSPTR